MISCPKCEDNTLMQNVYGVKEEHRDVLARFEGNSMVLHEKSYANGDIIFFCSSCDFETDDPKIFEN